MSGVCEVLWKQSEGAWKFFYEKNAVYEYLIYMSKIEINFGPNTNFNFGILAIPLKTKET